MNQLIKAKHQDNQSMNKRAGLTEKQKHGEDELSNTDEEINSCVTKLMTYLKVAEAQGENPKRFHSTDVLLMKVGEGRFSDVFTCLDKTTKMEVAVKIFKDTCKKEDIEKEVSMLEEISLGNPSNKFSVRLLKQCEHDGRTCLVFEKLEQNLEVWINGDELLMRDIRCMAIQLFLALDELKAVNILHADIHPRNIVHVTKSFVRYDYINLIDFGMAIKASDAQPGMELQTLEYRAPEIFLGLPFTEAIDVWGVGCILAFFYLGHNLFSASSEEQMVQRIVELLGQPEDHLLHSGKYTQRYFMEDEAADGPTWRLRNPGKQNNSTDKFNCLDDLVHIRIEKIQSDIEYEDQIALVDLLKQLLHVDANQRISARQALKHPFITMDHMTNHFARDYYVAGSENTLRGCSPLSEYLKDKSANWTPFQEFHVLSTYWDQEGRIILHGSSSSYTVLKKLGKGAFNYVVKCQNNTTKEEVAVKIPKLNNDNMMPPEAELATMKEINARNPDSNYIIKFLDLCEYRGRTCLIFEMLDTSIYDNGKLTLRFIRPIAKQLFLALGELKAINIQHYDIHEGNIMFVDKQNQPHRVKLIDFGSAAKDKKDLDEAVDEAVDEVVDEVVDDTVDEVVDEAVDEAKPSVDDENVRTPVYTSTDMSSVGCILVFLYLEERVQTVDFDIDYELGLREESESEEWVREYESEESESVHSQVETISQTSNNATDQPSCLEDVVHDNSTDTDAESEDLVHVNSRDSDAESEDLVHVNSRDSDAESEDLDHVNSTDRDAEPEEPMAIEEREDRIAFADLLKQMMHFDENQRISPCQALQHPFITMDHLINRFETNDYLEASQAIMNECPLFSTDTVKGSSGCPPEQKSSGPRKLLQRIHRFFCRVKKSDVKIPTVPDKNNPEVCLSGGGLPQCFNDEDLTTARSSEGAKPTDVTPAVSASSSGLRKLLQRIQRFFRRVKLSDGKIPTVPDENDPDVCPSNGEIPPVSDQDNSEVCLSGGGLPQCFNDEDLTTARSSEGAKPTDVTPAVSASSSGLRKLLQRIQRFFRRVKLSDGKIPTVPDENDPDVCPSNGEIPPVSDQDNSEVCVSGRGLPQCFNDEDLTARSSEGAKPTDFTPAVSASSGGLRKLLKRISRVKNYLCCCLHPDVED